MALIYFPVSRSNWMPQAMVAAISRRARKMGFDAPIQSAQRRALIFILILILRQRSKEKKDTRCKSNTLPPDALPAVETLLPDRES
jgi:hypothetical protein